MRLETQIAVGLAAALSACSSNNGSRPSAPAAPQVNALFAQQWCTIENTSTGSMAVTRYQLHPGHPNQLKVSYVTLGDLAAYYAEGSFSWVSKDQAQTFSSDYEIEHLEGTSVTAHGSEIQRQRTLLDEARAKNSAIEDSAGEFHPKSALIVKSRSRAEGDERTRTFFECASYSQSFLISGPQRPMIELSLMLNMATWKEFARVRSSSRLLGELALKFPIQVLDPAIQVRPGASWCGWWPLDDNSVILNVLTFGEDRFIHSSMEVFLDRKLSVSFVAGMADKEPLYSITRKKDHLRAEGQFSSLTMKHEISFMALKDQAGVEFFARYVPGSPTGLNTLSTRDVYFACSDSRPIGSNFLLKENVDAIVKQQLSKLKH